MSTTLKLKHRPNDNRLGFTIVELLVVIAIIGILSVIVIANTGQSKAKARDAKRVSDLAQIQLALAGFYDKCGEYPYGYEDTDSDGYSDFSLLDVRMYCNRDHNITLGSYINKLPVDPTTGKSYTYIVLFNNSSGLVQEYHLAARMETQNQALRDRAGFDSSAADSSLYYVIGIDPEDGVTWLSGIEVISDPLIYDVRPGL